jgi:hypothetical protein
VVSWLDAEPRIPGAPKGSIQRKQRNYREESGNCVNSVTSAPLLLPVRTKLRGICDRPLAPRDRERAIAQSSRFSSEVLGLKKPSVFTKAIAIVTAVSARAWGKPVARNVRRSPNGRVDTGATADAKPQSVLAHCCGAEPPRHAVLAQLIHAVRDLVLPQGALRLAADAGYDLAADPFGEIPSEQNLQIFQILS